MNKTKIGIFLSLMLVLGFCSSCGEKESNSKLLLNEVLITNESNFQDDYGVHSAWIEIFNKSYGSADLAGCYLKFSSQPGDTATYFIPKGDVLTLVKPRQHALFWADGEPNRGTFHTNFKLDSQNANWIGLYDSGKKLLDQIVVPAGTLQANQSYARVSDATPEWEVKGDASDKYVTPSTNNKTIDSNAKMEKFEEHDSIGIGMAISAMSVVFSGLLLLYISFKIIGKISVNLSKRNAMRAKGITDKKEAKEKQLGEAPGEVFAAISLALHEMQSDVHDVEDTVLTITRVLYLGDVLAFRCSYSNTDPIAQCTIAIGVHLQVLGSEGYIVNALGLTVSHYIVLCQAFIRQSISLVIQRRLYKFLIILFGQYSNAGILSCCRSALVREGDHSCGNAHQGCQHQGKQFLLVHFVSLL